jgi:hypothetical protein
MNKKMRALRLIFRASTSVTCDGCGRELKGTSLPGIARRGCPDCNCRDFSFHGLPGEVAQQFRAMQA